MVSGRVYEPNEELAGWCLNWHTEYVDIQELNWKVRSTTGQFVWGSSAARLICANCS